jgi:hypothetical protein
MQLPELYENFDQVLSAVVEERFAAIQAAQGAQALDFEFAGATVRLLEELGIPFGHQTLSERLEARRFVVGEFNSIVEYLED